jgi:hypothetical protein
MAARARSMPLFSVLIAERLLLPASSDIAAFIM